MRIFHLWKIKTSSLFTCICESSGGLRDQVHILMHWSSPPQKIDKIICHHLIRFSKYGYTYQFKYNSETLENFQCFAGRMRIIKLGRRIKVSQI